MITLVSLALAGGPPPGGWKPPPKTASVISVYDGDTVTLDNGDKVRIRWVNTPELKPKEELGDEARRFTENFVNGRTVELTFDEENPRDGYGRIVAGLTVDGKDLSEGLLREGLAHLFIIPPEGHDLRAHAAAEAEAREARKGIWSLDPYQGVLHMTSFHANAPGDDNDNVNGEYLRVANVSGKLLDLGGMTVEDNGGKKFTLPIMMIPPGHTFKLHSGEGEHQRDPTRQLAVYLGSSGPIWNNDHDVCTIRDPEGKVIDRKEHKKKRY